MYDLAIFSARSSEIMDLKIGKLEENHEVQTCNSGTFLEFPKADIQLSLLFPEKHFKENTVII
jgi:hypothetical protein